MEITPAEFEKLQRVIDRARAFVKAADEFFPEYSCEYGEDLSQMTDAIDDFWKEVDKRPAPPPIDWPAEVG